MPRALRYLAAIAVFGVLGAGGVGGAGAAVSRDEAANRAILAEMTLADRGGCLHRYDAFLAKVKGARRADDH